VIDTSNINAVSILGTTSIAGNPLLEQQETGQGRNAMNRGIE
jgi:hypothetical protein